MRVLVAPEYYRDDVTASGTVNDAVAWMREWLARDERLHVYVLAPPRAAAGYDPETLLADRERVTLLETGPPFADLDRATRSRRPATQPHSSARWGSRTRGIRGRRASSEPDGQYAMDGCTPAQSSACR